MTASLNLKYNPSKSPKGRGAAPRLLARPRFLPEAKTLLPGELISPGSFEIPGSPQSAALWGDLLETSQMDLFSMFG